MRSGDPERRQRQPLNRETVLERSADEAVHGRMRQCPPAVPFALAVGVTGHRKDALPSDSESQLKERLREVLERLRSGAEEVRLASGIFFANESMRLLFVSPLADGADQSAAELALKLGFELHAILPFEREEYRRDMADEDSRQRFDTLIGQATCVLELPGSRDHELDAYVMAGRGTVAHCDVLIAVWDGQPPRGRGGTGEIVGLAFDRGTPVIHVPVRAEEQASLRWSAFEPVTLSHPDDQETIRPFEPEQLRMVLNALLAPPPDPREQEFARLFQRECRRRIRARMEYPILLWLTGVARLRRHHWRSDASDEVTRAEWSNYCDACSRAEAVSTPINALELWYDWSDHLASHYAQYYRSGHVFNFVVAAVAVLLALATLELSHWKGYLAIAEFAAVLLILLNTWIGTKSQWHRRWLDYRQLAERLRPIRSLKIVGVAAPDPPGTAANPVSGRWVEWYASAVWRAVGCPMGRIDAAKVPGLATTIADHELSPQVEYHRSSARQAERLDNRLEKFGHFLFGVALVGSIALLLALLFASHEWLDQNGNLFTILSAGISAMLTAVFGIRVQGDYGGSAVRSEQTARVLDQIANKLRQDRISLNRVGNLVEQAARAMLSDLGEWSLLNQQHDLSIG